MPKALKGLLKLIGVLFLAFAVYVVWSLVRESQATDSAQAFCGRFKAGDSMADVAKAAASEGDKWHRIVKEDLVSVAYIGAYPFSRHFCTVSGKDGKVLEIRLSHLD